LIIVSVIRIMMLLGERRKLLGVGDFYGSEAC
jgi:hypothetical protein